VGSEASFAPQGKAGGAGTAGRDALERLKPFLKEREEHLARYAKQRDYQTALAALKARDPLFGRTMHLMEHYVGKLPEVLRKLVMPALAREFGLFAEFYRVVRESAWLVEAHLRAGWRKASSAPPVPEEQAAPDELAALKRRVKSGGAKEGDLLRYLELTGAGA